MEENQATKGDNARPLKVKLRKCPWKYEPCCNVRPHINWKAAQPFVVNPRGQLVHRVRWARTGFCKNGASYNSMGYWCGNTGNRHCEFTSDPPLDSLLCAGCEAAAIHAGEKSAAELTGRHVCIGAARALKLCCPPKTAPEHNQ